MTTKINKKNRVKIMMAGVISFLLSLSSFLLISCSESYLDVESKTESNTSNFYKSQNDAYRALIGCYDGWRQTRSDGG